MRIIKHTNRFKRDYRREKSAALGEKLDTWLPKVVDLLLADKPLAADTSITNWRASGKTVGIVTSGLISS